MPWSSRAVIALALALILGIGWAVALVVAITSGDDLTPGAALLVYALGGTLIGGLAGWMTRAPRGRHELDH